MVLVLALACAGVASGQYVAPRVTPDISATIVPPVALRAASGRTVDGNTVTVTQRVTVDSFVTQTDTVYNSVPVTITNVIVHTETLQTTAVSYVWGYTKHLRVSAYDPI